MFARVATLEKLFAAWSEGDWSQGADLFHEDLSFVTFNPDSDEVRAHGTAGMAVWLQEFLVHWADFRATAGGSRSTRDVIVVDVRQSGRGRTSGARTEMPICAVFRFDGERVVELLWLRDRERAYAAAGLGEPR